MVEHAREAAWAALMALAARPDAAAIRPLFAADPDRFARFSRQAGDVLLDFSKTAIFMSQTLFFAFLSAMAMPLYSTI